MIASCDGIEMLVRNASSVTVALQEQAMIALEHVSRWGENDAASGAGGGA